MEARYAGKRFSISVNGAAPQLRRAAQCGFASGVLGKEVVKRVTIKNELRRLQIPPGKYTKSFSAVIIAARREREIKIEVSSVASANITIRAKGCEKAAFTTRWIIVERSGKAGCKIENIEGVGPNGEP